ncbi:MAG: hypothetical protein KF861_22195 [Planctomycetaceae bacterium]|nr:hypothetical protein [Planctomycetaceae bacterium]
MTMLRPALEAALLVMSVMLVSGVPWRDAGACPFCFGSLQLSLREQIDASEATVIIRWKSGEPGNLKREIPASTTFTVLEILRGDPTLGRTIRIDRYQEGQAGDVFLMSGFRQDGAFQWDRSVPLSELGRVYLRGLPDSDSTPTERVRYALMFLESPDDTVATDAFSVLGTARYEDIAVLKDEFPRDKLRKWIRSGERLKGQLGVYGMLLGLCGDDGDRALLEKLILDVRGPDDYRLGIDGVMGGYLLVSGEEGLKVLDRQFLANASASQSDVHAVLGALRFMGQYADERISRRRLSQSLRQTLGTSRMPDIQIADLARWEDWTVTHELLDWYADPVRGTRHIKPAIVRFMIVASQADRNGLSEEDRASVEAAAAFVETLKQEQPAIYQQAARALVPSNS